MYVTVVHEFFLFLGHELMPGNSGACGAGMGFEGSIIAVGSCGKLNNSEAGLLFLETVLIFFEGNYIC